MITREPDWQLHVRLEREGLSYASAQADQLTRSSKQEYEVQIAVMRSYRLQNVSAGYSSPYTTTRYSKQMWLNWFKNRDGLALG